MKRILISLLCLLCCIAEGSAQYPLCDLDPFINGNVKGCNCSNPCGDPKCVGIVYCRNNKDIYNLVLSALRITVLPESFGEITTLENLELVFNELKELPQNFSKLTNLKSLSLRYNQIQKMDVITYLPNLMIVYLQCNNISTIPYTIKQMKSLSLLDVSMNHITTISPEISSLTALGAIYLNGNGLTQIPEPLFEMTLLQEIDVSTNKISIISENISKLTLLHYLEASNNKLRYLPKAFTTFTELYNLKISGNSLNNIPYLNSTFLITLDLHGNELNWYGDIPLNCPNLQTLYLSNNKLSEQFSFYNLKSLRYLDLDYNKFDQPPYLPLSITSLSMKANKLGGIFQATDLTILHYTNLTTLTLDGNDIYFFNDVDFKKLPKLTYLSLYNTKLYKLPDSIFDANLTYINIDNTCLTFYCRHWFSWPKNKSTSFIEEACQQVDSMNHFNCWPEFIIIVILICFGCVLITLPTILCVCYCDKVKMRRALRKINKKKTASALESEPLLSNSIDGLVEFGNDDSVEDENEHGIRVSPRELTFGSTSSEVPLDQDLEDHFTITGVGARNRKRKTGKPIEFKIEIPNIPACKCQITAISPADDVYAGEDVIVAVKLRLLCTTSLNVPIFVIANGGFIRVKIKADSQLSTRIDADEVSLGDVLGSGSFGTVYKGEWRGNSDLAIKVYNPNSLADIGLKNDIEREVEMCFKLRMPNIVSFYGRTVQSDKLYIVMELVPHGSLGSLLNKGPLDLRYKVRVALDVARGMNYLHKNHIIHRDLKSDNVLISSLDPNATICGKLSDFNTSRFWGSEVNKTKTRGVGTPIFMAPEILDGKHYSWMADVFSFGILLWNLWAQQEPYKEFESSMALFKFVGEGHRLQIPEEVPQILQKATSDSWKHNPEERPSFQDLVQTLNEFFTQM